MNTNTETPAAFNNAASGLAAMLVGLGLLGTVLYFTVVPLLDLAIFALYWILPLVAIAAALGLISIGTVNSFKAMFTSGAFKERVDHWMTKLDEDPEAHPVH